MSERPWNCNQVTIRTVSRTGDLTCRDNKFDVSNTVKKSCGYPLFIERVEGCIWGLVERNEYDTMLIRLNYQ